MRRDNGSASELRSKKNSPELVESDRSERISMALEQPGRSGGARRRSGRLEDLGTRRLPRPGMASELPLSSKSKSAEGTSVRTIPFKPPRTIAGASIASCQGR